LIETLRIDPQLGAVDMKRHLDRMCLSAQKLGFVFQRGFITEKNSSHQNHQSLAMPAHYRPSWGR